jgi:hypothetical protein
MSAGQFADGLALAQAEQYDAWGLGGYTIASIDLDGLADDLRRP